MIYSVEIHAGSGFSMRIALFNWRDIRHPGAGGAEELMHVLLSRLAARGHEVCAFTGSFPGCSEKEIIDGVAYSRYAGRFLMYLMAYPCYKRHIEGRYDVILESVNGPPFFTCLYSREPVISLIHQLTRENWYSGLPRPLAFLGYHTEDLMLRIFRDRPVLVFSVSTRTDLHAIGFSDVRLVEPGLDLSAPLGARKRAKTTIISLGRLVRSKRVDHAIRAFRRMVDSGCDADLWIVGSGPERARLEALSAELGLSGRTRFFGRVSDEEKARLLAESHLMLFPAVREGWGMVVLEANRCGTPVIGYDVHGLRDSIEDGINGKLVKAGDIGALADAALAVLADGKTFQAMSSSSKAHAEAHGADRFASDVLAVLEKEVLGRRR